MNLEQLNTSIASYQLHRMHYEHDLETIRILFEDLTASSTIDNIDNLVCMIEDFHIELGLLNPDSCEGTFDSESYELARTERKLANNKIKKVPENLLKFFPKTESEFAEYMSNLRSDECIYEDIESIRTELKEILQFNNPMDILFDTNDKEADTLIQNAGALWDKFLKQSINLSSML